ncbi:hypothetical protein BU25DRAFT_414601 [Macroventuria anomochaeta]|uniref:Uncharacterized protein n=1 Tax=Macroventuria anomochaeta TaxID=301207 RepID=A0ACB6RMQ5_9PLEO|nr:uncharacterized protein BU25DRAFT_414601 [Macroventuria anomochaeta]KAF2623088.1 hypothetical protein BU25DRAFT_414601 [Macroventuria anomochaeta]
MNCTVTTLAGITSPANPWQPANLIVNILLGTLGITIASIQLLLQYQTFRDSRCKCSIGLKDWM